MTAARDAFLQRVREAVMAGNRAGNTPALESRGPIGYQGAGPDPVERFRVEFTAVGGIFHAVPDGPAAVAMVLELVQGKSARRVFLGGGLLIDSLTLAEPLRGAGVEVSSVQDLAAPAGRDVLFEADLGITGVDFLVAETGTMALLARPEEPRSLSLLPPIHVALARRTQLVPDLFDLFAALSLPVLPSCLSLITGPSKTGDIELRLVTGVHGPGEIHLVLVGE